MLDDIVAGVAADAGTVGDARSARRIAAVIGRMITAGDLPVGTRLPTVRELSRPPRRVADHRVSEAWRSLAAVGAIEARGRNGTFVRAADRTRRPAPLPPRHARARATSSSTCRRARPTPSLLPDLGPIVARVSRQSLTSSYLDHPVLPALEEELRASWPFRPEAITVVDGAIDALDRVAQVVRAPRRPGRRRAPDASRRCSTCSNSSAATSSASTSTTTGRRSTGCGRRSTTRRPCRRAVPAAARPQPGRRGADARAGRARSPTLLAGTRHARRRGRPRQRHLRGAAGEPRRVAAGTAPCTSAATPRATVPTCAWPRSAAPATS